MLTRRKFLISTAVAGTTFAFARLSSAGEEQQAWDAIREHLFQKRKILPGDGVVKLVAPVRPPNSGDVTVRIESLFEQTPQPLREKTLLGDR